MRRYGRLFKLVRKMGQLILPKYETVGTNDIKGPIVYVSHHHNLVGPITILSWFPNFVRTWVFSPLVHRETCYQHYKNYTFTERFGMPNWLATPLAWLASLVVSRLLQSARVIPVYRKSRKIVKTIKESIESLGRGEAVIVFPDIDYQSDTGIVGPIYEGFLNLDRYYYKRYKEHINFVPLYPNAMTKEIRLGKPVSFLGHKNFKDQRRNLAKELSYRLNQLASLE